MNTGQKTNLVAAFSLLIVLGALIAIFFNKITGMEFVSIISSVGAFAGIMVAVLTKSHSYEKTNSYDDKQGTVDPDHPEYPKKKF